MKAVGITAEFNPLHSGHKYLIDNARRCFSSCAVVCVMSGNFVQHGGPAFLDKYTRAQLAVLEGADLVLELPAYYAVNSAKYFAQGSIAIMKSLGCVEAIVFGSETADAQKLKAFASMEENEQIRTEFHALIDSGISFSKAFSAVHGTLELGPNDTLGLEYLREARLQNTGFEALAVKRTGAAHGDEDSENSEYTSASALRKAIKDGDNKNVIVNLPESTAKLLSDNYESIRNTAISREKEFFDIIRYKLLTMSPEEIAEVLEVSEGLENRLSQYARLSESLDELILNSKSKRYTYSRLSRILTQLVLGLNKQSFMTIQASGASYVRVLAFNDNGAAVLRQAAKNGAKLITNVNKPGTMTPEQADLLRTDLRASDIYNSISGFNISTSSDQMRTPFILKNV